MGKLANRYVCCMRVIACRSEDLLGQQSRWPQLHQKQELLFVRWELWVACSDMSEDIFHIPLQLAFTDLEIMPMLPKEIPQPTQQFNYHSLTLLFVCLSRCWCQDSSSSSLPHCLLNSTPLSLILLLYPGVLSLHLQSSRHILSVWSNIIWHYTPISQSHCLNRLNRVAQKTLPSSARKVQFGLIGCALAA